MTTSCVSPQQLVETHQGLVRSLAMKIHEHAPPSTELEDLIAYGQVGLVEAARDFDPSRGSRFSTYAYYRIRGAIYDGLSKLAWFSRARYNRIRCEQMADHLLQVEGEEESDTAAEGLRGDVRWFRQITQAMAVVYLASFSRQDEQREEECLVDRSTAGPAAEAIDREVCQRLHELIEALPDEARTLIKATYFEGLTLQEAGKRLGVSKSWASRLHARTLQRLARSLSRAGVAS
jgi:RNA polymerase sigma factor for flagellar operon FliA